MYASADAKQAKPQPAKEGFFALDSPALQSWGKACGICATKPRHIIRFLRMMEMEPQEKTL